MANDLTITPPEYNDKELKYRADLIKKIQFAYNKRQNPYPEFNDMTYGQYWETNSKASHSYIRPKTNEQDVRVVTGTTEEKNNTLLASLLNLNLEPDIEAYDKDDELVKDLGDAMEDMVRKSRRVEVPEYEVKRELIYTELLSQGNAFVEDTFVELQIPNKVLKELKWDDGVKLSRINWSERQAKINKYCNANLMTGLNVYLGDMREFYMEYQPYIFTIRNFNRSTAKAIYGEWERWENVPKRVARPVETEDAYRPFHNWSLEETYGDTVKEIKFQDKWSNEYMIMLNGVMMFPVGFPLSALNGMSEYTIAKGDLFPISRYFAYSKGIPSKTKVDQQVFDEMLRLILLKTRQSFMPPYANNTGQALSKRIFFPGTMTPNLNTQKLQPVLGNQPLGVTNAEFNAVQFVKEIIDGKSVAPVFEGQATGKTQTAREIIELKQQSMMKMGVPILGVINLEKKLAWLRLFNILQNWTKPIDQKIGKTKKGLVDVFRKMTIDSDFEDGTTGKRVIEFMTRELPSSDQIMAEEDFLSGRQGMNIRKTYLDSAKLRNVTLNWFIEIKPTEKETSELRAALFRENITEAMTLFGPDSINMEYIKGRWATLNRENPDKLFAQQPQMMQQPSLPPQAPGLPPSLNEQMMAGMTQTPGLTKPSLNTLTNARP